MALQELIAALPERAGVGSVQRTLEDVACAALECYADAVPAQATAAPSTLACPPAAARHAKWTRDHRSAGLPRPDAALADYLRLERQLGRVRADADIEGVTALLLNACERRAFHQHFLGDSALGSATGFAAELVRTVMHMLTPDGARPD